MPVSELCDKHGLQPTVFYRWQKEFFENGVAAFQPKARPNHSNEQERIDYLEKKIQTEDEVLAESAKLSITCAAFWTAVAATSSTGICGSR